jgi:hypothetical protein
MLLKASCASKVKGSSSASEQNMVLETKARIPEEMDDAAKRQDNLFDEVATWDIEWYREILRL